MTVQINKTANAHRDLPRYRILYFIRSEWLIALRYRGLSPPDTIASREMPPLAPDCTCRFTHCLLLSDDFIAIAMMVYEGIGRETDGITIPSPTYYTYCGMRESNVRVAAVTMYARDVLFRWSRHFVDTADDTTYRRLLSTRCESLELSVFGME